jgi:ssDNA-binding Zn-finger/Zn-ribbon topoisomerase 1
VATYRKDLRPDTCVSCPTCDYEIAMRNTMNLPRDFSVQCPHCEGRKFYQAVQVHDRNKDAETTQTSGKIQFGVKGMIGRDWAPAKQMQPKSRFNAMASWLLQ